MGIAPGQPFHEMGWKGKTGEISILIDEAVEKGSYEWLTLRQQPLHNMVLILRAGTCQVKNKMFRI